MIEYNVKVYNDRRVWLLQGKYHRVDGPAVEWGDGSEEWWLNDQRHRVDGPAIIRADGAKLWYHHGRRHRVDGPAIEWVDGYKEWWLNGKQMNEEHFRCQTQPVKELTVAEIGKLLGYIVKVVE